VTGKRKKMSYFEWFEDHAQKHRTLVQKLCAQGLTQKEIIDYFMFENMLEKEPEFCLLYANKQKCHNVSYLNCYLCACPHFRFCDEGLSEEEGVVIKSMCAVNAKRRALFVHENIGHLDCSRCTIPHTKAFIEKHFDMNWKVCMKECATSLTKTH